MAWPLADTHRGLVANARLLPAFRRLLVILSALIHRARTDGLVVGIGADEPGTRWAHVRVDGFLDSGVVGLIGHGIIWV